MNCPRCQTVNPDGAKFCLNCGTTLCGACPNCATPLPPGAKLCPNCRYALVKPLDYSAQARLWRRTVSVLFCDVQDSIDEIAGLLEDENLRTIFAENAMSKPR